MSSPDAPVTAVNLPQVLTDPETVAHDARVVGDKGGAAQGTVALVPTMGALHEGHLSLVRRARRHADRVVVSIFVNPLQFGKNEDFDTYPRDLGADLALLAGEGVEVVFAPTASDLYPAGRPAVSVNAGPVSHMLEGRSRPGHFDGALTVVLKLLNLIQPDVAVFGEKDAQQLFLIKSMVADLNVPVTIVSAPIARAADGLALSSRNQRLSAAERTAALALPRALEAAEDNGHMGLSFALSAAQSVIVGEPAITLDYLAAVDPYTFRPVDDNQRGEILLLVAARVGSTRLIDNRRITFA